MPIKKVLKEKNKIKIKKEIKKLNLNDKLQIALVELKMKLAAICKKD